MQIDLKLCLLMCAFEDKQSHRFNKRCLASNTGHLQSVQDIHTVMVTALSVRDSASSRPSML